MIVVSIATFLTAAWFQLDRRLHRNWDQLARRVETGTGRWVAYRNAGVLLEMIDFARRAERPIDAALAEALRVEAMRVRLAIWMTSPWA